MCCHQTALLQDTTEYTEHHAQGLKESCRSFEKEILTSEEGIADSERLGERMPHYLLDTSSFRTHG